VFVIFEDLQGLLLDQQSVHRIESESLGQVVDGEEVEELDQVVQIKLIQVVLRHENFLTEKKEVK
jgi:hypothetical protein